MHNAQLRHQLERVWEIFWQVGMHDPRDILEQILYLLFLRRLDGITGGPAQAALRWEVWRSLPGAAMLAMVRDHVYPALRKLGRPGTTYALHLKDVQLKITSAPALFNIVAMLDHMPRQPAAGDDPFDYVADKLARLGLLDERHTPGPIELLMVTLVAPVPGDVICSPVSGCGNFLVAAARYLKQRYGDVLAEGAASEQFHHRMFHGYDADKTMLRIACMKLLLEGVGNPALRYTSSLVPDIDGDSSRYSVILAHPSMASFPGTEGSAERDQATALMLAQFVRSLAPGGRAAVIVPGRTITGMTMAAATVRQLLTQEQRLTAVIPLPHLSEAGAGGSKSLLVFARTGRTRHAGNRRTSHVAGRSPQSRDVPLTQCNEKEAQCSRCVAAR